MNVSRKALPVLDQLEANLCLNLVSSSFLIIEKCDSKRDALYSSLVTLHDFLILYLIIIKFVSLSVLN